MVLNMFRILFIRRWNVSNLPKMYISLKSNWRSNGFSSSFCLVFWKYFWYSWNIEHKYLCLYFIHVDTFFSKTTINKFNISIFSTTFPLPIPKENESLLLSNLSVFSFKSYSQCCAELALWENMLRTIRRCVPPCSRPISDYDKYELCFECLSMASVSTVSCSLLKCFITSRFSWGIKWQNSHPSALPVMTKHMRSYSRLALMQWADYS